MRPEAPWRVGVATCGGVGYSPWAPGTAGSIPGAALAWGLVQLGGQAALLAGIAAVAALGWWSAGAAARALGSDDPGPVVIDEVAGQMLALAFVPVSAATIGLGFLLFRLFDVIKPPPLRRLESLPGASGIMLDDLAAAVYANLILQIVARGWA